jgi:filamentous hemagglutinin
VEITASTSKFKNDVIENVRVSNGKKGSESGNKVDITSDKTEIGSKGKPISVYPNTDKPVTKQEFPPATNAHGFNDIINIYAGNAVKTSLKNGATLYQLEGNLNGTSGRFEWLIYPKLGGVSHRMFVSDGKLNGVPAKS